MFLEVIGVALGEESLDLDEYAETTVEDYRFEDG